MSENDSMGERCFAPTGLPKKTFPRKENNLNKSIPYSTML